MCMSCSHNEYLTHTRASSLTEPMAVNQTETNMYFKWIAHQILVPYDWSDKDREYNVACMSVNGERRATEL